MKFQYNVCMVFYFGDIYLYGLGRIKLKVLNIQTEAHWFCSMAGALHIIKIVIAS